MQVKASSLSPHSSGSPSSAAAAAAAAAASNYGSYAAHHSYYPGVGVDLSYFGNHVNHHHQQYSNHYIGGSANSSSTMLRPSGLASDYEPYSLPERYQPL